MSRLLSLFLLFLFVMQLKAQILPDPTLTSDFKAEVKSFDEFKARFNGEENKPGIKKDANQRRNNILGLFDLKIDKKGLNREQFSKELNAFTDSVLINDVKFNITDKDLWVECRCRMKYKGKIAMITLVFQHEKNKKNMYRWTIVGVRGMDKAKIIDTDNYYSINPAEHEIHFMGLHDYLNANPTHVYGYRKENVKIDMLPVFFTMIRDGVLIFDVVEEEKIHYYGIPGYIIEISELNRKGQNSGWLITSFEKASKAEKINKQKQLLGYE